MAFPNTYHILWYILIYSFAGWCIEVVFCSANTGKFVNRGFLYGPVCPIYGFGGTIVIVLLGPLAHNILVLFFGSVLLTSLLELATGYVLFKLFHTRWWNYSSQPFNIGGYVCLKFSLAWGLACILLMRVVHPFINGVVEIFPRTLGWVLLGFFWVTFLCDIIVTTNTLLKLNRDLGEITRITDSLHKQSESMAKTLGTHAIGAAEKLEELPEKMEAQKERLQALTHRHHHFRKRLLRAFPAAHSSKYENALNELMQKYEEYSEKIKQKIPPKSNEEKEDMTEQ